MSWSPLILQAAARSKIEATVRMSAMGNGGRYKQSALISITTADLPEITWLVPGRTVEILQGHGEHAGWLRIQPGSGLKINHAPGRRHGSVALRLFGYQPLPAEGHKRVPCEHDYDADWLEIRLPAWAVAPTSQPATGEPRKSGAAPSLVTSLADTRNGIRGQGPIPMGKGR